MHVNQSRKEKGKTLEPSKPAMLFINAIVDPLDIVSHLYLPRTYVHDICLSRDHEIDFCAHSPLCPLNVSTEHILVFLQLARHWAVDTGPLVCHHSSLSPRIRAEVKAVSTASVQLVLQTGALWKEQTLHGALTSILVSMSCVYHSRGRLGSIPRDCEEVHHFDDV